MNSNEKLSKIFADTVIKSWPDPTTITKKGWEYNNSIILYGIEKIYLKTKDKKYLDYIKKWVDSYIDDQGNIDFNREANNLDLLHPGLLLLFLYEETGLEKYKKASLTIRKEFDKQPRNKEGGFWHKQIYENEIWIDGIYMAEPFLIKYGFIFNEKEYCSNEAVFQTLLIAKHAQDKKTGLLFHGWHEDKNVAWADKKTGASSEIWSRGMGWYAMALVEILKYLPREHKNYKDLIKLLNDVANGIRSTQDAESGLWFQVMDKGHLKNNWIETSGSCMFIYALKIAADNGYIDKSYIDVANKAWNGIKTKIKIDSNGIGYINDTVTGMGVQNTYNDYISKEKLTNSTHGLCGILLASSAMEY